MNKAQEYWIVKSNFDKYLENSWKNVFKKKNRKYK